jgi:hypothetical protein
VARLFSSRWRSRGRFFKVSVGIFSETIMVAFRLSLVFLNQTGRSEDNEVSFAEEGRVYCVCRAAVPSLAG